MANIYGIVYALIAFGILAAAGKYMALLFVDGTDPELMNRIQQMLLINSGSYTFLIPAYLYVMRRVEDFFAGKREQL